MKKKCSFVAVVGEPNSGKSTLVNLLVGEKVSIVSNKIQTTRRQIKGITEIDEAQIVFLDTPGFCKSRTPLEQAILSNFRHSYKDADVILLIIDATSKYVQNSLNFLWKLQKQSERTIAVVINKTDIAKKENILQIASQVSQYKYVQEVFMISALKNDGIEPIRDFLKKTAPEGPWLYEEKRKTDLDIKSRLSEITREKIFLNLNKELPYSIYVETESFRNAEKKARINQVIVVMKESQKGIVLGKNADMIKRIKEQAIKDMGDLLKKKIELKIFVKVKEKWTEKRTHLQNAGIID